VGRVQFVFRQKAKDMGYALPIDLGQLGLNVSGSPRFFAKIDPRLGREIGMYGQWQLPQQSGLVHGI
jgi:hypothetical protein